MFFWQFSGKINCRRSWWKFKSYFYDPYFKIYLNLYLISYEDCWLCFTQYTISFLRRLDQQPIAYDICICLKKFRLDSPLQVLWRRIKNKIFFLAKEKHLFTFQLLNMSIFLCLNAKHFFKRRSVQPKNDHYHSTLLKKPNNVKDNDMNQLIKCFDVFHMNFI